MFQCSKLFVNVLILVLCVGWNQEAVCSESVEEMVDYINSHSKLWQAENSSPFIRRVSRGAKNFTIPPTSEIPEINDTMDNLPKEFDSRLQWPFCPSIGEITDQSSCASCWAVSAVDAMTDRMCIHSKGKYKFRLSAANLINCCGDECGNGCGGGYYKPAWLYWINVGLVSGGPYEGEGCQPYEFKSCKHLLVDGKPSCIKDTPTPPCKSVCQPNYNVSYNDDLSYGKSAYSVAVNEEAIKTEIYRNGPVQGSVKLYSDLYLYQSGVYEHVTGHFVFHHAIRIIGWGVDNATNVPYWLVANSFNRGWGENGFFRIKRGTNECFVEDGVMAGMPRISDT